MRTCRFASVGIALLLGFLPSAFSQPTVQQILRNGPNDKRINIVFFSEGYTTAQLGQFLNDAGTILNNLLGTAPFNEYPGYYNAFAISVASVESGSDHPSKNVFRNTYFNSVYESFGISQLVTIPPNDRDSNHAHGSGKVNTLLQDLMPEYDISIVLVNDPVYGGSGGRPLITSVHGSSSEIALHELGHSFAGLGDEYSSPYPGYPAAEEPNTTRQTNRDLIKWRSWIMDETPIPTPSTFPDKQAVGLFEGAHYHTTGWYRPKASCKMRSLGVPFCEVCAEALLKSTYGLVRPIESFSPPVEDPIPLLDNQSVTLEIVPMRPSNHDLLIQWSTNGVAVAGAVSSSFTLSGSALPSGPIEVKVEVADGTDWVRTDPSGLLKESKTWIVGALRSPPLSMARAGGEVVLSWPTTATDYFLQSTEDLNVPVVWAQVNEVPTVVENQFTITNTVTGAQKFYRLRKP